MSYKDFISKNNLWREYYKYRANHLDISTNRAMRSFCVKHGYVLNRRQIENNLQNMIQIAKVNLYELC